ncbi:hypothetical protein A9Q99_18860 [Gammaproteobacteria bacterium 45_16_T64]|nr:hypothetical protein A9Q99_18860 [Gammaproteobacteria bacterium 45_16_T64]
MNKALIPLAAVTLLSGHSIANAAEVYGRLHFTVVEAHEKDLSIVNAGHRLGVKGTTKLDSGNTAFFKLETEYGNDKGGRGASVSSDDDANISVRYAHAGIERKYGTVTIGRSDNPMNATYVADMFEYNSGTFEQSSFRIANSLQFKSKPIGPVSLFAAVVVEGQGDDGEQEDMDAYVIGGQTKMADFNIVLAYMKNEVEVGEDATTANLTTGDVSTSTTLVEVETTDISLGVSYSVGAWYAGLNLERFTTEDHNEDGDLSDESVTSVVDTAVLYSMDKVTFGMGYAMADVDLDEGDDPDTESRFLAGAYYSLGGNADVYLEMGRYADSDSDNNLVMGYRMTF